MALTRRNFLIAGSGALLAQTLPAYSHNAVSLSGRAFGGQWRVVVPEAFDAKKLVREIRKILAILDRTFNPFRSDSEIALFNNMQTTDWQKTSRLFSNIVGEALRIAKLSNGAFNPGVGPDVARFGFGPIVHGVSGNFTDFMVQGDAVRKQDAALTLDLCGIAKGHAVSAVADVLAAHSVDDFLIEISGEVMSRGIGPDATPWRIGIADPFAGGVHTRIAANDLVFATSGDAINAYEVAGRRYSHTIDPATGHPVQNAIASVTVGAPQGATADALATALLVMGPEKGLQLAAQLDVPVLYLMRDDTGAKALSNAQFNALKMA